MEKEVKDIGNFYRIFDSLSQKWKRISFWTDAKDVEIDRGQDGKQTVADVLKGIKGINTYGQTDTADRHYGTVLDELTFNDFVSVCKGVRFVSRTDYDKLTFSDKDEGYLYFIYEE